MHHVSEWVLSQLWAGSMRHGHSRLPVQQAVSHACQRGAEVE